MVNCSIYKEKYINMAITIFKAKYIDMAIAIYRHDYCSTYKVKI